MPTHSCRPDDPASAASISKDVVQRFGMITLAEFEARGHQPKYFEPGTIHADGWTGPPRGQWHNAPTHAVAFFKQLGESLRINPLPTATAGLNGIPLRTLPSWVVPQDRRPAGSSAIRPLRSGPHAGSLQASGLTANGFRVPSNWGPRQIAALRSRLQRRAEQGQQGQLNSLRRGAADQLLELSQPHHRAVSEHTSGLYVYRAVIVVSRRLGQRATRRGLRPDQQPRRHGGHPARRQQHVQADVHATSHESALVAGPSARLPPTVNNGNGDPRGFWSIHVYQTDATQSAAPFITQTSVLNTSYSSANMDVTDVDEDGRHHHGQAIRVGLVGREHTRPLRRERGAVRSRAGHPLLRRVHPKQVSATLHTRSSSRHSGSRICLPDGNRAHPGSERPTGLDRRPDQPGRDARPAVGPVPPVSQLGSQQLTSGTFA